MQRMRDLAVPPVVAGLALVMASCGDDNAGQAGPNDSTTGASAAEHDHKEDDTATGDDEHDGPAYRLLVADGEAGTISLLNVGSGDVVGTVEVDPPVEAPTMFATAGDGRLAFAIMYDRDGVQAIDAGVWAVDHGDHVHDDTASPQALALYSGGQPAHVVGHDGRIAVFYDADGEYRLLDDDQVADGDGGTLVPVDAPHHGVVVPWDAERTIVTAYGDTDPDRSTLPPNVVVHNTDGDTIQDDFPACPELHGEAAAGDTVSFACADGILTLEEHGDHFDGHKLDYPDDDGRTGTLRAAPGMDVLVGNYTENAFLVVDPAQHTVEPIEIPESFTSFAVTAHGGGALLGVSPSGAVHTVDIGTGEVTTIENVVTPFAADVQWTEPSPQIAAGPDALAFVTDPAAGQVHEIDLDGGDVHSHELGGTPFHIAVAGMPE